MICKTIIKLLIIGILLFSVSVSSTELTFPDVIIGNATGNVTDVSQLTDSGNIYQDDIGADCGAGDYAKGVDDDGTLDCDTPAGAGSENCSVTGSCENIAYMNYSNEGNFTVDDTTFHIDSDSNNVGIGTDTPDVTLHIYNASVGDTSVYIDASGDKSSKLYLTEQTTTYQTKYGFSFVYDSFDLYLKRHNNDADGTDMMFFERTNGNVGIGTTSVGVNKLYALGGAIGVRGDGTLSGGYFKDSDGTAYSYVGYENEGIYSRGQSMGGDFADTDGTSAVGIAYGTFGIYQHTGTRNYFAGSVGIGQSSPTEALHLGTSDDAWVSDGNICVENSGGTNCAGSTDGYVYADDYIEHTHYWDESKYGSALDEIMRHEGVSVNDELKPNYETFMEDVKVTGYIFPEHLSIQLDDSNMTETEFYDSLIPEQKAEVTIGYGMSIGGRASQNEQAIKELYAIIQELEARIIILENEK